MSDVTLTLDTSNVVPLLPMEPFKVSNVKEEFNAFATPLLASKKIYKSSISVGFSLAKDLPINISLLKAYAN